MTLPQRHIIFLLLFFTSYMSVSQDYIHYTKKDGLAGNYVYRMTQDNEGFIWFLTETGMSKFDGKTFKNFTTKEGLPVNDIWHIRITSNNRVWYFTRSDELGYIKNDSVFRFKSSDKNMMNPNGGINQSGNNITILGNDQNYKFADTIWEATSENMSNYKLLNKEIVYVEDRINAQLENTNGKQLLVLKKMTEHEREQQLNDSLFVRLDLNSYEIVNLNSLETKYSNVSSFEVVQPKLGNFRFIWSNDQLQLSGEIWLICFDDKLEWETLYDIPKQLKSTHNFKDKDGFIWLATSGNGVYKLPIGYQKSISFFKGKKVTKVKEIDGVIYIGVEGEGVYRIIDNNPTLWIKENSNLWGIAKVEGAIFYTFENFLHTENYGVLKKIERKYPSFMYAKQFVQFNGTLYSEGFSGITRFSNDFKRLKGYDEHQYYQNLFTQNDTLFSFSYKQMLYYEVENDEFLDYKKEQIQKKSLTSTTFNEHTYIGTEGDGLHLFKEGKLHKLVENDLTIINNISVENQNSIWAVSEGVLLHYVKNKEEEFSIERYNQISGFATNNINEVYFENGKLYIGSSTGLTIINKEEITDNINFIPYIKNIYVNNKRYPKDSLAIKYDKDLNIKVNFGSINYFDAENTTLQYQLSPIQKTWISTESGEVNLFDLQPNNYVLQLKVTHNEIEKTLEIPISLLPQWWQTRWFKVAVFLASIVLLAFIFWYIEKRIRYKKNKKIIQEKQLAQIELKALRSQMNPHFVFNSLTAIQYYINSNEIETSEAYLIKFSKLIRQFFELSKEKEITIEEEIEILMNYLDIEKLRFKDKLSYKFIVDKNIDIQNFEVPTMLLQPIVENAVNHGVFNKLENGTVTIKFIFIAKNEINVAIIDDGVGIKNTKKKRNGKLKSSNVLKDRLYFINQSGRWKITYSTREAFLDKNDKGNISTFNIKKIR